MISKGCYVYFQLPRSKEIVTAGRIEWQKGDSGQAVGRFVYGKKYLAQKDRVALDEFILPLEEREFKCTTNEGVFGPIRDASPDSWGRYVIEKNTPNDQWDEIGYLLNGAEDRAGALSFGVAKTPPAPVRKFNATINLDKLIAIAHELEQDHSINAAERTLLFAGGSMGGARPKTTVEQYKVLWLAKFPSYNDRQNISKIEFATMQMAKDCGLQVPDIRLESVGGRDVFLIKRFDRDWDKKANAYIKSHFISGLTALDIDERDRDRYSYLDLADQLRRRVKSPKASLRELFSRMVFNALVSNTDDHPRNHGLIYNGNSYDLSPLYDVVPKPAVGTERFSAMLVGSFGRSFAKSNLLSRHEVFDLNREEAEHIYSSLRKKISNWRKYFNNIKVSDRDISYVESAFNWEQ